MSDASATPVCVLRASGRRFAAKRYLATSTMLPENVEEHAFELTVSRAAADDQTHPVVDDALDSTQFLILYDRSADM